MEETLSLIEYRKKGHGEAFNYHSHQEYEIYLFHNGACRYLIQNQIYDLNPGDILLMNGLMLHKPNVLQNSEYIRSVVHFSPYMIKGILTEMDSMYLLDVFQNNLIRTKNTRELKRLEEIISRLSELDWSPKLSTIQVNTEMKVLLLQALISVYKLRKDMAFPIVEKKEGKAEHAENIAAYIQSNYSIKLSLDTISEALNLSKSYLSHVFKEMTGFTVMEYVMGCRLTQVKYLLEMDTEKSLKDIAFECGFESVSHFSRFFREKVGMTAREYRILRCKN